MLSFFRHVLILNRLDDLMKHAEKCKSRGSCGRVCIKNDSQACSEPAKGYLHKEDERLLMHFLLSAEVLNCYAYKFTGIFPWPHSVQY